jgi:mono/diheme cytochrome c family protein
MAERRRAKSTPSPLDEAHEATLRAIRRRNNLGKPDPLLRGISEAQAEKVRDYVRGLGRDPDRLERVAYNAILDAAVAKYWREQFRKENAALRGELERLRAAAAEQGRKGSRSHAMRDEVIAKMAAAIAADPPEHGTRWPDEKKAAFSRALNLAERPAPATWSRWWLEAERRARAERIAAENEALDRLGPLMDELCAIDPPNPGEFRDLRPMTVAEALEAARGRKGRKPPRS